MSSTLKGMVSRNKIRYKEDGYDLDLSYICKNVIAMGFPAETFERFYRNHINDVARFFDTKHPNQFIIYNLCSESKRRYDTSKFQDRVDSKYSFQDHNPPPFEIIKPFCENVHSFLKEDENNVVAIHCKAGKGRTGVMICAYLVHAGQCTLENNITEVITDAVSALNFYGRNRTYDSKGVTIPSQKRYVYYYDRLVKRNLEYRPVQLKLSSLIFTTMPIINAGNYTLTCDIFAIPKAKIKSFDIEVKKGTKYLCYHPEEDIFLTGDIKFEFSLKKIKNEKLFQLAFNTFFVGYPTDTGSVVVKKCSKCSGQIVLPNLSVMDLSFLHLDQADGAESADLCSCDNNFASSSLAYSAAAASSSSSEDHPPSMSSSSSSSNSSISSLCRKIKTDVQLGSSPCKSTHSFSEQIYLVIPKDKLDKAYKDKVHKIYPADFKVVLKFQTCPSECSSTETSAMPIELGYEKICCSSAVLDSLNSSTTSDTSQATSSDDPQSSSTIVFRNDDKDSTYL